MVIPKVDSVAYVDEVSAQLDAAGAPVSVRIWPMIETPTAMFNVREIAAHPRVAVLVMGTNDLAKELRSPIVPAGIRSSRISPPLPSPPVKRAR